MHKAGIIRRELSPRFIYLTDDRAVLTDFELAQLLDGSQSVSIKDQWSEDDAVYRAKEVGGEEVEPNPNCDLYSWAVILAHALSGQKPRDEQEAAAVLDAQLPRRPRQLKPTALKCLMGRSKRPAIEDLMSACKRW